MILDYKFCTAIDCRQYVWEKLTRKKYLKSMDKELSVNNEYWNCDRGYCEIQNECRDFLTNLGIHLDIREEIKFVDINFSVKCTTHFCEIKELANLISAECDVDIVAYALHRDELMVHMGETVQLHSIMPNAHIVVLAYNRSTLEIISSNDIVKAVEKIIIKRIYSHECKEITYVKKIHDRILSEYKLMSANLENILNLSLRYNLSVGQSFQLISEGSLIVDNGDNKICITYKK